MVFLEKNDKSRENTAGAPTRYPIFQSDGSIYPTNTYLKTTTRSLALKELADDWTTPTDRLAICFPIIGEPFFESMSVHQSKVPGLSADKN